MSKVEALEREVQALTPEELAAFRDWFAEYDWQAWEHQIARDVAAGKLDRMAAEALSELERGFPLTFKPSREPITKFSRTIPSTHRSISSE